MNIKVTLEFNTWAEAVAYMESGEQAVVEVKKSAKAVKPAPLAEHSATEPLEVAKVVTAVAEKPATAIDTTAGSPEITYADVSAAVLAKMKTDRAAVMAAAAKFGVKNAKELKQEQWADFIKEIA